MEAYKDFEIFDGKNMSDLLQDIYKNSTDKKEQIEELVNLMQPFVQNIEDATMLMPAIKDYIDVAVKNDKQLIDLGNLIQKIVATEKRVADGLGGGIGMGLTDEEKAELKEKVKDIQSSDTDIAEIIKSIPNKVD